MKKAGQGHIINIVSMAGFIASSKSSLYQRLSLVIGFPNALRLEPHFWCLVSYDLVNPNIKNSLFDLARSWSQRYSFRR